MRTDESFIRAMCGLAVFFAVMLAAGKGRKR